MAWEGIVSIASRRRPVCYSVHIRQGWDGELAVMVRDTVDDERSRKAVADAMRRAADLIEGSDERQ